MFLQLHPVTFALQTLGTPAVDFSGVSLPVHHGHVVAQLCQPRHRTRAARQDAGTHMHPPPPPTHKHAQVKGSETLLSS